MSVPKFNEAEEMKVVAELPSFGPGPGVKVYNYPVTPREAYLAAIQKKDPVWQISGNETALFCPRFYPDNVARAFVFDAEGVVMNDQSGLKVGGPDMFGIEWVFVPAAGGSMVQPGKPLFEDANEWKSKVKFPNIDAWDWAGGAKKNEAYLKSLNTLPLTWIMNGFFERLISFMDFEGAATAMIDEEQQDAVKELMDRLADLYIKIVDNYNKYFGLNSFTVHDDWGSQMAPFFSPAVGKKLIVPAMRKLTDHIHAIGGVADFHSCGHVDMCVPNMIDAGWDSWSGMAMNDTHTAYEKYGDKIVLGVIPEQWDPASTPEDKQKAEARKFVDKFCKPGKPCLVNYYGAAVLTPAFREELYRYSRSKLGA
ncbi:MAG: hypothetical protein LBC88_03720 [Spirochaetaceae bacterium]|jgi:hypothetical protein|nr:hypothetical protein [Spirochaetaceae bacterium]